MLRLISILLLSVIITSAQAKEKNEQFLNGNIPQSYMPDSLFSSAAPTAEKWWESFNDRTLDSLITLAVKNNQDVFTALDNITTARTSFRIAQSGFYPSLNLTGGWDKTRGSRTLSDGTSPYADVVQDYAYATVSASWEIDIFGAIRKQAQNAKYYYLADIDTYNAVIMSLVADMATYYATLRTYQQQLIVANKNIASQKAILNITEVRYNTGLASQLDVAQAKSVYFSTQSSIPVLESSIRQQINAITALAGMFPPQLYDWLNEPQGLPEYIQIIPVGIPENILSRRPDISAAVNSVKAAEASVAGAKTGFLPKFYLDGSFGFASKDMNRLFNNNSITYQISPKFNWTLFQGAAIFNASKKSKSQYDAAVRSYNTTLLNAMQEVDNAMASYSNRIKQVVDLRELVVQGEVTLRLSLDLYKGGLANFQNVLDAQRSLLEYQNSLVSAQGSALTSLIALYRAIGGGWQSYEYQK